MTEHKRRQPFAILTDKSVVNALGARIWLISGRGSPTSFQLHYVFTADHSESGEDYGFHHRLRGTEGSVFNPPVSLNNKPWFAYLKATQFFSRGLAPITHEDVIEGLIDVSATIRDEATATIADTTYPDEVSSDATYFEGAATSPRTATL